MRLAEYLKSRGVTQTELSRLSGVPQPQISKFLGGREPSLRDAVRLHIATGGAVSLFDLLAPDSLTPSEKEI